MLGVARRHVIGRHLSAAHTRAIHYKIQRQVGGRRTGQRHFLGGIAQDLHPLIQRQVFAESQANMVRARRQWHA